MNSKTEQVFEVRGDVLGHYEILEEIGRGAQGITYRARDRETGGLVALKRLNLRDLTDWKAIELFEREGRALKGLKHEGIPRYIDAFHQVVDEDGEKGFVLVQEYVEGENLEVLIGRGLRMGADEVRGFLTAVLGILTYLHGLERPVIHRDIKPSNIMRRVDGRWVLIDFGAVQLSVNSASTVRGATTVVGTTGYMPFEQILGGAVPASDLYALGATMVHVLSHRHPNDLPVDESDHMRLLFAPYITTGTDVLALLEWMLEPLLEDRVRSAEEVLAVLEGKTSVHDARAIQNQKIRGGALKRVVLGHESGVVEPISGAMAVRSDAVCFKIAKRGDGYTQPGYIAAVLMTSVFVALWVVASVIAFYVDSMLYAVLGPIAVVMGFLVLLIGLVFRSLWSKPVLELVVNGPYVVLARPWFLGGKKRFLAKDIVELGVEPVRTWPRRENGYRVRVGVEGGKDVFFGTGQTRAQSHWLALMIEEAIEVFEEG